MPPGTLEDLIRMTQGSGGGQAPAPAQDPIAQLKALMSQGAATGSTPQGSMYAGGGNPMGAALAMMLGNAGTAGAGRGPATDSDVTNMAQANQNVRGNLPREVGGMDMGFTDDLQPMPDPRQTPMPDYYKPNVGAPGAPGQAVMGAYNNRNKPPSTEQELDMVSRKMGGDPSDNGDFPPQKEIDALNDGSISPQEFDAKWGKGAAKEMMDDPNNDGDPTTRKLPIDKQKSKSSDADDGPDDDYDD